jgi:predicted RNA-binding Zn ribbon-like protein
MAKPITEPPEWRRRAQQAPAAAGVAGWGRGGMAEAVEDGLAALDSGDDARVRAAADVCRAMAWDQPDDLAGIRIGDETGDVVLAHRPGQRFDVPAAAAAFLARAFEALGDVADLEAAIELHDTVVALGEPVWETARGAAAAGWAGAVLHEVTGEQAFLATAERGADVVCEMQAPDGSWGDAGETALVAWLLLDMADSVEARAGVDPPVVAEGEGGGGEGG